MSSLCNRHEILVLAWTLKADFESVSLALSTWRGCDRDNLCQSNWIDWRVILVVVDGECLVNALNGGVPVSVEILDIVRVADDAEVWFDCELWMHVWFCFCSQSINLIVEDRDCYGWWGTWVKKNDRDLDIQSSIISCFIRLSSYGHNVSARLISAILVIILSGC